jgi:hypothetical protein
LVQFPEDFISDVEEFRVVGYNLVEVSAKIVLGLF